MRSNPAPARMPLHGWMLALLCAVYLLAGTLNHDPWKPDDAVHLGIAWEFANNGDWLTPRIGIETVPAIAPLYHWVAALLGETFSFLLPFHDAARLASPLFGALLLLGLAVTARTLNGQTAWAAPFLAIGTLGLLMPIHDAQPAIAIIAAQAFAYAGVAMMRSKPVAGALVGALAVGAGFWSGGLLSLPAVLVPFLFVPMHADWRKPRTLAAAAAALALGVALAGLWPLSLAWLAPEQFAQWWNTELARFNVFRAKQYMLQDHFELLAWFVWPILPLALWSLWIRRTALGSPPILLPLAGIMVSVVQYFLIADPKPVSSLHLIVPLSLLALPGAERLRRGASNALDWFGMMTFTLFAALIWLGGVAMATGSPERVARNFSKAEPGFVGHFSIPAFIIAALLTVVWLWILFRTPRSPWRSATRWAAGLTVMWGLVVALWLPWVDYARTYRPVALSLGKILRGDHECVASKGVGLAQKASLRYFMGLAMRPLSEGGDKCRLLLIQGASGKEPELKGMKKIWEGYRGGDKSERLRLYRRS